MCDLTVLMPAYNAAAFLDESVRSIMGQTYRRFELLIIDDASTDESAELLSRIKDSRVRVLRNEGNRGIAATLNRGIEEARGEYIARMDADDIAYPRRLERQLEFMERHPDVGVLGTWVRLFGDQPCVVERQPVGADVVKAYLVFDNPLFHPSVMMRRSVLLERNLRYNPEFSRTEDYELWTRAAAHTRLDNVPEALVHMRAYSGNITTTTRETMTAQTGILLKHQLAQLGMQVTDTQVAFHHDVSRGRRLDCREDVCKAEKWLRQVAQTAACSKLTAEGMMTASGMIWFRLCRNCSPMGMWILQAWRRSPLSDGYRVPMDERLRWLASIAWHMLTKRRKK